MGIQPSSVLGDELVALRLAGARWYPGVDGWTAVPEPMPRVRLVGEITRADDSDLIRAWVKQVSLKSVAIVSDADVHLSGSSGTSHIVGDRPGLLTVETVSNGGMLLITTERFHPGWQATVDGHRERAVRVYGDFLGCPVPAGAHRVILRFNPDSFRYGLYVSVVGGVLALAAAVVIGRGKSNETTTPAL
jgi:hypothetical protein